MLKNDAMTAIKRCPHYRTTPLLQSPILVERLGCEAAWLKDERNRFDLGSFKALGGAYAVWQLCQDGRLDAVFCCASAGNHGLSVAAGAKAFGAKAVIVLSSAVSADFEARICDIGADVIREGETYEASMQAAGRLCEENDWVLLSDSSWADYTEIPTLVMEGYTVMAEECEQQFRELGRFPSHIFLQAGVGGLAASFTQVVRNKWPVQPEIYVVEPDRAACLKESVERGHLHTVTGPLSCMGRLDCKEASMIAYDILQQARVKFLTIADEQADAAAQLLSRHGVPTTPSGAAGVAAALTLPLGKLAQPLVIVTEGLEGQSQFV